MRQALILLLIVPVFVWADSDAEINQQLYQYESELVRLQQEAQAAHQQFMMIQEMRRHEMYEAPISTQPSASVRSVPFPKYDDMVQKDQEKQARIQQYSIDLDALYLQHKALEEKRRALYKEIDLIKRNPQE